MARNFVVARPQEADASRMAEIHIAAMDANPLLHAQCPTPESLRSLQRFLEAYYAEQLRDPSSGVLIARDPGTGVISGFAKWNSPSHPEKVKLESGSPTAVEGCQRKFLDRYVELAEKAKRRCFGDQPCYSISFVCTDPAHQGKGVGTLLTQKVLELAMRDRLPVYLESTDVAIHMYRKLGFRAIDEIQMEIPRPTSGETTITYREVCMVWQP
ncbi:hypothetical protein VTH82DRAFT_7361 [Thermothelomyces myriococcoides]